MSSLTNEIISSPEGRLANREELDIKGAWIKKVEAYIAGCQ